MIKIADKSLCCGCKACANICPQKCIQMVCDKEGFCYPKVDESKCINCGLCNKICPIQSSIEEVNKSVKCYAAFCKHKYILNKSSSGGIFYLFARYILQNDGVVFGASFNDEFNVYHTYVDKIDDLHKLQGSKYVQSDTNEIYIQVEQFLKVGRLVYFSGTPCQIEALLKFLGKEYDNLITQDIICHGVPSAKLWQMFLHSIDDSVCKIVSFRNKSNGWRNYSLKLVFENGKKYHKEKNRDAYMKSFAQNLILRPSCYDCKFKKKCRISDITLADFWGVWNVEPKMYNKKGTSLVILNSEKAHKIFSEISFETIFKEVDFEESVKFNSSMYKSANKPQNRQKFFDELNEKNFVEISKLYCNSTSFCRKFLLRIKRYIRH